jgi:hypothetical protein
MIMPSSAAARMKEQIVEFPALQIVHLILFGFTLLIRLPQHARAPQQIHQLHYG